MKDIMRKMLKVKAVGDVMVQNYHAMSSNIRRYIGRVFDESVVKYDEESLEDNKITHKGGWVLLDEVVEVPNIEEYRQEVRLGNLLAIDEETARLCGVKI